MNIKKIVAGSLAALTAGATMLFAAFASPAGLGDYVKTDTNAITSPIIVIGAPATSVSPDYAKDVVGAADIAAAVAGYATKTVPGIGYGFSVSDGALVATSTINLYINDTLSDVKSSFTDADLSILASGEVKQKGTSPISYIQRIATGGQFVTFNKDIPESKEPVLNVKFGSGDVAYTYKVVFTPALNVTKAAGQTINLLGKEFLIDPNAANLNNQTLVLYAAGAQEVYLTPGETKEITIEGKKHTFGLTGVSSADQCGGTKCGVLLIDGTEESVNEGEVTTIDTTDVWIKRIDVFAYPQQGGMLLSIGAQKFTLKSGEGIYRGSETSPIEGTEGLQITAVDIDKIVKIELPYKLTEDVFLKKGDSLADGVFNAFKITFGGIAPDLKDPSRDAIVLKKSGDYKVLLEFANSLGQKYSQVVYYYNSGTGLVLQDGSGHNIWIDDQNSTANIAKYDYFVVNKGKDSFILQYLGNTSDTIKVKEVSTGSTIEVSTTYGKIPVGEHEFEFSLDASGNISVDMDSNPSTTGGLVPLYTKSGAKILLDNSTVGDRLVDISEPDFATTPPTSTTLTVNITASGGKVSDIDIASGVDLYEKEDTDYEYGVTTAGTYVVHGGADIDKVEIYTLPTQAIAGVAFGPNPVITVGGAVQTAVKIQQPVAKLASEINPAALTGDLILLGGPCANSLVATLMAADNVTCDNWPYSKGIIKEYANAFGSGHKALVVAGTTGTDTRELAAKVMQGILTFSQ